MKSSMYFIILFDKICILLKYLHFTFTLNIVRLDWCTKLMCTSSNQIRCNIQMFLTFKLKNLYN